MLGITSALLLIALGGKRRKNTQVKDGDDHTLYIYNMNYDCIYIRHKRNLYTCGAISFHYNSNILHVSLTAESQSAAMFPVFLQTFAALGVTRTKYIAYNKWFYNRNALI